MAKVLIGLSGDGRGHSSRCKATIAHLLEKGHEVKVVTSGKGYEYLHDYYNVVKILGYKVASDTGQVNNWRTLTDAFEKLSKHGLKTFRILRSEVENFKPDAIISDFEPFVIVIGAYKRIPLISIDNQHVITLCHLDYPKAWLKEYIIAWLVCNVIGSYSDYYFLTCFFQPKLLKSFVKKATQVGPILRQEVLELQPTSEDHILIYIRTPELSRSIGSLVEKLSDQSFCAYGFETTNTQYDNIIFNPPSEQGFLQDLAAAKAVITNGGHSLISEALYLGKPIYSIPTRGDFEQMINAYYVEKLGYGMYTGSPSPEHLQEFLHNLDSFKLNIAKDSQKFNGNDHFFELLDSRLARLPSKKVTSNQLLPQ